MTSSQRDANFIMPTMLRLLLCRSLSINSAILSQFSTTGLPVRGAFSITSAPERKRWNHRCAVEMYRVHKLHKFYWQHEMHFCLYRSSTVKYAVFSLYFAPCLRRYNSRTDATNTTRTTRLQRQAYGNTVYIPVYIPSLIKINPYAFS